MKKLFSVLLFSISGFVFAAESIYKFQPTPNGYGYYSEGFYNIEPQFINACFLGNQSKDILEIGAALGHTLAKVSSRAQHENVVISYTAVEISEEFRKSLNDVKDQIDKSRLSLQFKVNVPENGDIKDFIKKNEMNKYDIIYAGSVLHFFDPVDYLLMVRAMHKMLKPDGKLFIIVSSTEPPNFSATKQAMLAAEKNGDLWPGFITDPVRLKEDMMRASFYKETYGHLNLFKTEQTSTTMSKLLKTCGFSVLSAKDYKDETSIVFLPMGQQVKGPQYLGVIAQKTGQEDTGLISKYAEQALVKREMLHEKLVAAKLISKDKPVSSDKSIKCGNPSCNNKDNNNTFQRCSRCKSIWYCGQECQKSHRPNHKLNCQAKK